VRELRNVIERCVLFSDDDTLPVEWLQLPSGPGPARGVVLADDTITLPLDGSMSLEEMDKQIVQTALERHDYNLTAAARQLGTTRQTLRYRAQKHDLKAPEDDD
jgi:transcriptional regulator with PAS, ATPase and Fis domain